MDGLEDWNDALANIWCKPPALWLRWQDVDTLK